ncbi:transmembrane protein 164 [Phlebotomus argentipes]|uniref:transmembrane protein 164 n=1 Tax=Phlebotomus argentipes TaxID=94469 RepID=UPI002893613A|nr:transmembrane protein 164 [Phlebotomus argentipes]XP_059622230.1 transmembrane protein 164 [Phlebotomus argentipes]
MHWGWAYDGVNASVPRNCGPECANFLSTRRQWCESILVTSVSLWTLNWAIARVKTISRPVQRVTRDPAPWLKQLLLVGMTLTFGLELGFKFASRTVIYVLNPCHITTIIQIYLLAAKPSNFVTIMFRIQMNYLNGPLLAFLFPETDSRQQAMEATVYWIQHGLMFIIPVYLLRLGGVYTMEPLSDVSWNVISYSICLIYHFVILEIFAVPTQVNLNHMLCPALLDPFTGPSYRLWAVLHQAILCPLLGKLYYCLFAPSPPLSIQPIIDTATKLCDKKDEPATNGPNSQIVVVDKSGDEKTVKCE